MVIAHGIAFVAFAGVRNFVYGLLVNAAKQ